MSKEDNVAHDVEVMRGDVDIVRKDLDSLLNTVKGMHMYIRQMRMDICALDRKLVLRDKGIREEDCTEEIEIQLAKLNHLRHAEIDMKELHAREQEISQKIIELKGLLGVEVKHSDGDPGGWGVHFSDGSVLRTQT